MIIYNVTVNVDEDVLSQWLKWMSEKHIPDVMKTGLFKECKLSKILAEEAGGRSYSVQYLLENWEDYYRDDYRFQWSFCRYFWECHVEFPEIDIDNFNNSIINYNKMKNT